MPRRRHCNHLNASPSSRPPQPAISPLIDSALVSTRSKMSGHAAKVQMSEDMRQAGQREGGVTGSDLELLGWTETQVKELARDANIRAQRLAGMTV
jgi:hypothetical protein